MRTKPRTDPTSWEYQAAIHGTYLARPLSQWNQCRHGSWYFVSWHRMYLYYFERIVRAQVVTNGGPRDWALPYWNYAGGGNHNTLPPAFRSPTLAGGSKNPLNVAQRNPGINAGAGLPASITSPAFALSRPTFTGRSEFGGGRTSPLGQFLSETGRLEQTPHNDIHVAIGGLMGDPDTAAQDPIFWLHHANIDRLWWLWEQRHRNPTDVAWTGQSFDFVDAGGGSATLTGVDVLDTERQLGYTYYQAVARPLLPFEEKPRMQVKWPWPWPERPEVPQPSSADAGGDVEPLRSLVGATDKPIRLVGEEARVPIAIDERATQSLSGKAAAVVPQHRAFLDIEGIDAERNPGTVYGVYVNLPEQPTQDDLATHHVGNISLFGVERARNPRGDEQAHGLRVSMEITELLDRLAAEGTWQEGGRVEVALRPITLEPPEDRAEGAAQIAPTGHPDTPITIGRISVQFA
ncbi:MAG: tyrosinase family protein [Actinomycetota bacterium]|nr:tyrosinase family protein [Actinomycetota bacterium]